MRQAPARSLQTVTLIAVIFLASTIIVASADLAAATPGRQRWVKRFNYSSGSDFGIDGAVSPDGSTVFVTGASLTTSENHDIRTIAYRASDGNEKWVQRYGGPFGDWDIGSAIAVSPDGSRVFVTGTSYSNTTRDDFITLAYAASGGRQLWMRRYTRASDTDDEGAAILVAPDGQTVFVTGRSHSPSSSAFATVAYAAADGTRLWRTVSDGINQPDAMAQSPDGTRLFVTGGVIGTTGNKDYVTIALDATTGAKVWEQRFNGDADGDDAAMAVGVGPAGSRVFVTGRSDATSTLGNYATIAYGADDGSQRWVRRFHAPAQSYAGMALAVAPNGSRIVATGYGARGDHEEFVTVAYGASGAKAWADRYDGPIDKNSLAFDVAITRDSSKAIVTGQSWAVRARGYDVATIAYGVTHGPRMWVRRYDGPDSLSDRGSAVTVAPNGSTAFVIGKCESDIYFDDYLTIAYSLK